MNNQVDINLDIDRLRQEALSLEIVSLREKVLTVLDALKVCGRWISLLFCGNERMEKLNEEYRGEASPTDVLAFEGEEDFLGDIAISIDKVLEQSKEYDVDFDKELMRLLIHGILHLLGYDHQSSEEEYEMKKIEHKIYLEVK